MQTKDKAADLSPALALEQEVCLSDKCHRQEMVAVLVLALMAGQQVRRKHQGKITIVNPILLRQTEVVTVEAVVAVA